MDEAIAKILADVESHSYSGGDHEFPNADSLGLPDADSLRLLAAEVVRVRAIYFRLLDACIKVSHALKPIPGVMDDGQSSEYCPACGGEWTKVEHHKGCTAVLVNQALDDVKYGSP
jgi:hypothetical protein